MRRHNYDVNQVIAQFLENKVPERRELVREITDAMRDSRSVKFLLSEIGHNAANAGMNAIDSIGLAVMYGCVLGILFEKERIARKQLIVA